MLVLRPSGPLGFIIRNTQDLTYIKSPKVLCCALVRPEFECGSVMWNPYQAIQIINIERIQNKFLHYLGSKSPNFSLKLIITVMYVPLRVSINTYSLSYKAPLSDIIFYSLTIFIVLSMIVFFLALLIQRSFPKTQKIDQQILLFHFFHFSKHRTFYVCLIFFFFFH